MLCTLDFTSFLCMTRFSLAKNASISARIHNIRGNMMFLLFQVGLMLFDFQSSPFSSFSTSHHHCRFRLPLSSCALTCFHLFSQMTWGRPSLISPSVYTCFWTLSSERLFVSLRRFTAQRRSPLGTVAHPFVGLLFSAILLTLGGSLR